MANSSMPEDTRLQRERMDDQQRQAIEERGAELSMARARDTADQSNGLYDGQSGDLLETGMSAHEEARLAREIELSKDDSIVEEQNAEVYEPGNEIPEYEEAIADFNSNASPVLVKRAKERKVRIRINQDVDPTIGQGADANWHFKAGRRYLVPERVATHLDEKGLISSWG